MDLEDVRIDIRSGGISFDKRIELIKQYDEAYPSVHEDRYLEYYQMSKDEFYNNIDKWANKDLLEKCDGFWHNKEFLVSVLSQ